MNARYLQLNEKDCEKAEISTSVVVPSENDAGDHCGIGGANATHRLVIVIVHVDGEFKPMLPLHSFGDDHHHLISEGVG